MNEPKMRTEALTAVDDLPEQRKALAELADRLHEAWTANSKVALSYSEYARDSQDIVAATELADALLIEQKTMAEAEVICRYALAYADALLARQPVRTVMSRRVERDEEQNIVRVLDEELPAVTRASKGEE